MDQVWSQGVIESGGKVWRGQISQECKKSKNGSFFKAINRTVQKNSG